MEAIKCIKERRSVRRFTEELVPEELFKEIVGAAVYAPSWKNTQISRYTLIQNEEVIQKIADEACMGFKGNISTVSHAKNLVVVSYVNGRCGFERDGSYTTSKGDSWQMFDAGIAVQTFCLAAHDCGIGSVIMGIFDEKKIAEIVGLPENETTAALLAIGYPNEVPAAPKRKDIEDIVRVIK